MQPAEQNQLNTHQAPARTPAPFEKSGQLGVDFSASGADALLGQPVVEETAPTAGEPVPPSGPPPKLSKGMDDIFWTHQLQKGLTAHGFSIDDEEVEDWIFGEATEDALLTFQVCGHTTCLLVAGLISAP